ncbi:WxcM-like domain-containing protein, partial [Escherichia coli]|nr:WxcM-like domain-containing protein [Escherichia coli]
DPTRGLLIEPGIWHEMYDYSKDCILMVLASDVYDESDYIRSYESFQEWSK